MMKTETMKKVAGVLLGVLGVFSLIGGFSYVAMAAKCLSVEFRTLYLLYAVIPLILGFLLLFFAWGILKNKGWAMIGGLILSIILAVFEGIGIVNSFAKLQSSFYEKYPQFKSEVYAGIVVDVFMLIVCVVTAVLLVFCVRKQRAGTMIGQQMYQPHFTPMMVKCPYCNISFQITPTKKPFKVKCPSCGKESMLR
ncbi:MAG: hypothetical protein QMC80_07900 [Thermoplasmatales archaeon]|nr:hypothetical protein [Thermoplasmatales archaeon]